VPPRA